MTTCGYKACPLPGGHISDCEPTHAGKVAYWSDRALDIRASMERDGLSLDEVGKILIGAAPTLRPPPMPLNGLSARCKHGQVDCANCNWVGGNDLDELEPRCDLSSQLDLHGGGEEP